MMTFVLFSHSFICLILLVFKLYVSFMLFQALPLDFTVQFNLLFLTMGFYYSHHYLHMIVVKNFSLTHFINQKFNSIIIIIIFIQTIFVYIYSCLQEILLKS